MDKPKVSEVDVFGLTHTGKVRKSNADAFLIASFHRAMHVHASSIPAEAFTALSEYSRGFIFLVADGVGAFAQAATGSARAIQSIADFFRDMPEVSLETHPEQETMVAAQLAAAVEHAHKTLLELGQGHDAATTLTMWIGLWPRAFVIHVGDSRLYRLRGKTFERLTKDQTMAEAMIDAGAVKSDSPAAERLSHILVSALGSSQVAPSASVTDIHRRDSILLCTDGLTKHVSDDEIKAALESNASAETMSRELVDLVLERGGSDNVTVVVGRIPT